VSVKYIEVNIDGDYFKQLKRETISYILNFSLYNNTIMVLREITVTQVCRQIQARADRRMCQKSLTKNAYLEKFLQTSNMHFSSACDIMAGSG
jgi:hypothetical protein